MTREELSKAWAKFSSNASPLGGIVQNPVEGLTEEDLTEWLGMAVKAKTNLEGLIVDTLALLIVEMVNQGDV